MGTTGRMLEQSGADCPTTRAVNELPGASGVAQVPVRPVLIKEITYIIQLPCKMDKGVTAILPRLHSSVWPLDCENILCNLASRTLTLEFQLKRAKSNP